MGLFTVLSCPFLATDLCCMLSDNIRAWLDGSRNFIVGRALYKQVGKDEAIKAQLQKGEHAGTTKLLADAMEALLVAPVIITPKVVSAYHEMPSHSDLILQALRNEWLPLFSRLQYLRASLDQWGERNDPEAVAGREPLAFEILDLEDQCEIIWEKRDHYLLHNALPVKRTNLPELPADPVALAKMLETVKKNIRRNRAKMNNLCADVLYTQLYLHYKSEYTRITGKEYDEKN